MSNERLIWWMKTIRNVVIVIGMSAVAFIFGIKAGEKRAKEGMKPIVEEVIIHDTLTAVLPVYVDRRIVDSVKIPVIQRDTIREKDSIFIKVPIEQKEYRDTNYQAWVSGYRPRLDSIKVVNTTKTIREIQIQKEKCRWGLGVQAGYGFGMVDQKVIGSPYIGVGISYNLLSW